MKTTRAVFHVAAFLVLAGATAGWSQSSTPPVPLIQAHSHNDYLRARPLLDALDHGFCSVEADIHLVDGQLLVAHDRDKTRPDRTLQSLYLDPLRERVKRNGGRVYRDGAEVTLLIDLKQDWQVLYPSLRAVLTNYADILTSFRNGRKETNAVLVIVSGNRSREIFAGETVRYAALDGGLADLDSDLPANLVAWISAQWGRTFKWRGVNAIPKEELARLKQIVAKAHQQGRRVRFWGAPDQQNFWAMMRDVGVDLINTDDLPGLQEFLCASKLSVP